MDRVNAYLMTCSLLAPLDSFHRSDQVFGCPEIQAGPQRLFFFFSKFKWFYLVSYNCLALSFYYSLFGVQHFG